MQVSYSVAASAADDKNRIRYNAAYIWTIACVAACGGLLFGYDWVVIGGAKPFYEQYFQLTSGKLIGWANSSALVGCLIGSIACAALSDQFGRKKLLLASALLFLVSSVLTGMAESFFAFVTWRIVGGVAIGIASVVSPAYIAEISPARLRGRLVTLNQLAIVVGILVAQIANWLIAEPVPSGATAEAIRESWNGQWGWRWMFIAVAGPSAVFLFSALAIPESPRWLIERGRLEEGRRILEKIGGETYGAQAATEIQSSMRAVSSVTWRELLQPRLRGVLVIGMCLAILQQWSGINVIFNYAEEIYRGAGYEVSGILFNIVVTGAINLLFTIISFRLVDRLGRRALMLFGCAGIALAHALLGFAYLFELRGVLVLVLTLCTIGCYALTLAPVTWVLITEIFPNRMRGLGVSIAVSALWIACFLLTFTFPILNRELGPAWTFWTYGAICVLGLLFIKLRVPETSGKTLEQIEHELAR